MKKPSFSRVLFDCGIVVPRRQRSDYVSRHSQLVNDSAWEENTTMKEVASFMNKDGLCLFIKSCRKNPSKTTLISKKIKKHTRSMFCMFIFFFAQTKKCSFNMNIISFIFCKADSDYPCIVVLFYCYYLLNMCYDFIGFELSTFSQFWAVWFFVVWCEISKRFQMRKEKPLDT